MRERLKSAFDHFWDVRMCTHEDIAQKMRNAEVDIAIDLKGFTKEYYEKLKEKCQYYF